MNTASISPANLAAPAAGAPAETRLLSHHSIELGLRDDVSCGAVAAPTDCPQRRWRPRPVLLTPPEPVSLDTCLSRILLFCSSCLSLQFQHHSMHAINRYLVMQSWVI